MLILKENETNFWFVVLQNLELIKKKNENMKFFMKILQGLMLKHAKHAGCHFSLISDVTPSIPIYLFNCIKTIVSFLEFRHNG